MLSFDFTSLLIDQNEREILKAELLAFKTSHDRAVHDSTNSIVHLPWLTKEKRFHELNKVSVAYLGIVKMILVKYWDHVRDNISDAISNLPEDRSVSKTTNFEEYAWEVWEKNIIDNGSDRSIDQFLFDRLISRVEEDLVHIYFIAICNAFNTHREYKKIDRPIGDIKFQ